MSRIWGLLIHYLTTGHRRYQPATIISEIEIRKTMSAVKSRELFAANGM